MDDGIAKNHNWIRAIGLAGLKEEGRALFRHEGRQIALFATADGIFACNNRCPHEGYPLREGSLGAGCVLTCNWHNWKFDLASGEALVGRDPVRTYRVAERGGQIFIDFRDPPAEECRARALSGIWRCIWWCCRKRRSPRPTS